MENPFVAFEEGIVAACTKHEQDNHARVGYRRFIHFAGYIVKFGDSGCFSSEALTHDYLANIAKTDLTVPRIPLIYHTFKREHLTYAIIEPVETITVEYDVLVERVANAILWMRRQAPPAGVVLGPLGSGPAWHAIFAKKYAPLKFTSVAALERYLNTAVSTPRRRGQPNLLDISICGEPLVLTQSDMDPSNFGIDASGRVVIFDFGEIGWLPESLANYTLLSTIKFTSDIAARVFGDCLDSMRASPNMKALGAVKTFLGLGTKGTLGLDKDGNPKSADVSRA